MTYSFDKQSSQRIASAVKRVENSVRPSKTLRHNNVLGDGQQWVRITAADGSTPTKYSWVAVEPNANGTFTNQSSWGTGSPSDNFAVEIDNRTTPVNEVVLLRWTVQHPHGVFQYPTKPTANWAWLTDLNLVPDGSPCTFINGNGEVSIADVANNRIEIGEEGVYYIIGTMGIRTQCFGTCSTNVRLTFLFGGIQVTTPRAIIRIDDTSGEQNITVVAFRNMSPGETVEMQIDTMSGPSINMASSDGQLAVHKV